MSRNLHLGVALLCGIAVIWLVPIFAVLVSSTPGLATALNWLRAHQLPAEIVTWGCFALLPVAMTAVAVGLVLFRMPGNRKLALAVASSPFILYSLAMNIGLFVWAGSSLYDAAKSVLPWLIALMVPLGFLLSMLVVRQTSEA